MQWTYCLPRHLPRANMPRSCRTAPPRAPHAPHRAPHTRPARHTTLLHALPPHRALRCARSWMNAHTPHATYACGNTDILLPGLPHTLHTHRPTAPFTHCHFAIRCLRTAAAYISARAPPARYPSTSRWLPVRGTFIPSHSPRIVPTGTLPLPHTRRTPCPP